MIRTLLIAVFVFPIIAFGQNRNSVWVFGDSAGIDFSNLNAPVPCNSAMDGRGSCASISNNSGQLLFYSWDVANTLGNTGRVFNWQHQQMVNGDSIVSEAWYQEFAIIPMPGSVTKYYLFSVGVGGIYHSGLYYSIIDMAANGGLGEVINKNVQLNSLLAFDGITTVKHGNGRDWWLIFKPEGSQNPPNNDFYIFLISPAGISQPIVQSIGFFISTAGGQCNFSKNGDKLLMTDWKNLLQVIDFDRCSGQLSNAIIIEPEHSESGEHFGNCFSPNGNKIYITRTLSGAAYEDSWLYQYDLTAPNIAASRDTIYHATAPAQGGEIRLGPDGKVYLSMGYYAYSYPFADTTYFTENMNLSVINQPDILGVACDFQPFSFYLGGKRIYYGLPNNPDYELEALSGSNCDTLGVNISEQNIQDEHLFVFYHAAWQTAFINAINLSGKKYILTLYDLTGKEMYHEEGVVYKNVFTISLNCSTFSKGLYVVSFSTEKELVNKKFIVQ